MHIVQITPTSYSAAGVIGGGERLALYVDAALRTAAAARGMALRTTIVALDGAGAGTPEAPPDSPMRTIPGRAWDPASVEATALIAQLRDADAVYVHQCLAEIGLFAAAHARLLGKPVYGSDSGGGVAAILRLSPDVMGLYAGLHALSAYAAKAYEGFGVPVHVITGPVDAALHPPGLAARDDHLVVALGRVLPHKGFERTIRALPPGMALVVVGQHYDAAYLAFLRDCARGKDVQFRDDLDDAAVRALLRRAGLFVHASTHLDQRGQFHPTPELLGLAPLEALASGTTTLVSRAGALPELGALPGCHVFADDAALAALLAQAAAGRLARVPPAEMHAAVAARYGLAVCGAALLRMMGAPAPCAS